MSATPHGTRAARQAENPIPKMTAADVRYYGDHGHARRCDQRAARKVRMARKKRRGW